MERTKYTPKRLLSLLLALIMLLGMLPTTTALAATSQRNYNTDMDLMTITLDVGITYDGDPVMPGEKVPVTATWSFKTNNDNTSWFEVSRFRIDETDVFTTTQKWDSGDVKEAGKKFAEGTIKTEATADINGTLAAKVEITAKRKQGIASAEEKTLSGYAYLDGVELSHYQIICAAHGLSGVCEIAGT